MSGAPESKAERFLALHRPGQPLLMPNPWDIGSVKLLETAGFEALATTSSGFAATLGRMDGSVSAEEALAHGAALAGATDLPVSADLEHGFADDPEGVAATVAAAAATGLAGCSIEDSTGDDRPIYDAGLARERIDAAVEAARSAAEPFVLTARAENHVCGVDDLDDTVRRLQSFSEAGADVVFAPGLSDIDDIRRLVESVDRPVNVLAWPGGATVAELAGAGVARVSVGGWFSLSAIGAVVDMAAQFRDEGVIGRHDLLARGRDARTVSFSPDV